MSQWRSFVIWAKRGGDPAEISVIDKQIRKWVENRSRGEVTMMEFLKEIYAGQKLAAVLRNEMLVRVVERFVRVDLKGRVQRRRDLRKGKSLEGSVNGVWVFVEDEYEGEKVDKGFRKKVMSRLKKLIMNDYVKKSSKNVEEFDKLLKILKITASCSERSFTSKTLPKIKSETLSFITSFPLKPLPNPITYNVNFLESFFKREENEPLYKLYNILTSGGSKPAQKGALKEQPIHGATGMIYSKISKLFTKTYGK
jgi:hypothetical protein